MWQFVILIIGLLAVIDFVIIAALADAYKQKMDELNATLERHIKGDAYIALLNSKMVDDINKRIHLLGEIVTQVKEKS